MGIPKDVMLPIKLIMNLNKKRNVTKITAKNVTLTTKMSPLKKKYNFVSHLWYEIATYRDLKFVVPNTDQNVLPGFMNMKWRKIDPNVKKFMRKNVNKLLRDIQQVKSVPNGQ